MSDEPATDLTHEDALGLLDALHDGELDEAEAARVEAHVAGCARCKAVEAALGGGLRDALKEGEVASSKAELLPGVQRKLRLRSRGRFYSDEVRRKSHSPWPLVIASLAVLMALVVSYLLLGQVGATSAPSPSRPPSSSSTK